MKITIPTDAAMMELGKTIATQITAPGIIFLEGPLGAGKTTFVRGFLQGKGHVGKVKSPTYALVEPYVINQEKIYHFDFYRVTHFQELADIGIEEYFTQDAICLIEWAERMAHFLPKPDLTCKIKIALDSREVDID